jgi:hypothetical protein
MRDCVAYDSELNLPMHSQAGERDQIGNQSADANESDAGKGFQMQLIFAKWLDEFLKNLYVGGFPRR